MKQSKRHAREVDNNNKNKATRLTDVKHARCISELCSVICNSHRTQIQSSHTKTNSIRLNIVE